MLQLKNVSIGHGSSLLLKHANLDVFNKNVIGFIGDNGSGKSSLFAAILGHLEIIDGEIAIAKHVRMASLAQEMPALEMSALRFVISSDQTLSALLDELADAEKRADYDLLSQCHQKMYEMDCYRSIAEAAKILTGLGFTDIDRALKSFSGGWRMRLQLARCLFGPSELLLLDEPTNHLDMEAIIWLENYIKQYKGAVLLVSHDQDFLDSSVTHIAHLNEQRLTLYKGDFTSFELQRAYAISLNNERYKKQQAQIAHSMKFIDRFRFKATKAKQAQSRLKALERMEMLKPLYDKSQHRFQFQTPKACGNPLVSMQNSDLGYGNLKIIENLNLSILPKQRIGLLGLNGAGKSTFIKTLCQETAPLCGTIEWAQGLSIGYFAQHQVDALPLDYSPLTFLRMEHQRCSEKELMMLLDNFGIDRECALASMRLLSGGEKARIALANIVAKNPNLLLLDEPTNHLDLTMRRALESALQSYEGALILVSHDRCLLRSLVDELYLIEAGQLCSFRGSIDDYQAHKQ